MRAEAPFRPATTDRRHGWRVCPNLARSLVPTAVNQLWVADITYVRMREEFIYLAVMLDALSRRVVGWAMAEHLRAELVLAALTWPLPIATSRRVSLVHHSDQGVQYACGDYIARLQRAGIQPSMSRAGCPWDNAMAESFMRTLKREEVNGQAYRDLVDAEAWIGSFIEEVYNRQRCIRRWLIWRRRNSRRSTPRRHVRRRCLGSNCRRRSQVRRYENRRDREKDG